MVFCQKLLCQMLRSASQFHNCITYDFFMRKYVRECDLLEMNQVKRFILDVLLNYSKKKEIEKHVPSINQPEKWKHIESQHIIRNRNLITSLI